MKQEITELKGKILNRIETKQKNEDVGVCILFTDSGNLEFESLGTIMQVNIDNYHYIDNAWIINIILSEDEDGLIDSEITYLVINGILCCQWVD